MAEYLLIFRGGHVSRADEQQSPEKWQEHMQKWMEWMSSLSNQGKLLGAQPLKAGGKLVTGSKKIVTDGPFIESKETVGGYLICKAENIEEATEISKKCPVLNFEGVVEIREIGEIKM